MPIIILMLNPKLLPQEVLKELIEKPRFPLLECKAFNPSRCSHAFLEARFIHTYYIMISSCLGVIHKGVDVNGCAMKDAKTVLAIKLTMSTDINKHNGCLVNLLVQNTPISSNIYTI